MTADGLYPAGPWSGWETTRPAFASNEVGNSLALAEIYDAKTISEFFQTCFRCCTRVMTPNDTAQLTGAGFAAPVQVHRLVRRDHFSTAGERTGTCSDRTGQLRASATRDCRGRRTLLR